ncbi:poly(A)-specific ribonuclease, partial [Coemansia javaensis]
CPLLENAVLPPRMDDIYIEARAPALMRVAETGLPTSRRIEVAIIPGSNGDPAALVAANRILDEYTRHWNGDPLGEEAWPVLAVGGGVDSEVVYLGDGSGRLTVATANGAGEALSQHASVVCAATPLRRVCGLPGARVFAQSDDAVLVATDGGRQTVRHTTLPNDAFTAAAVGPGGRQAFVCTAAGGGSLLDLDSGRVVRRINVEASVGAAALSTALLVFGTAGGALVARDARAQAKALFSDNVFGGPVADVAISGHYIYACGRRPDAQRPYGMAADPTVRVYDVRSAQAPLGGIDCGEGGEPAWLRVAGDALWICHSSGYAETRVLSQPGLPHGPQYADPELDEYSCAVAFAVAPSGQAAVVADSSGTVHVWAPPPGLPRISTTGRASEYLVPDGGACALGGDGIDIGNESVSLACVAVPATDDPLLSRMDEGLRWDVGRPVNFVDPAVISTMQTTGAIGYAPSVRGRHRNQRAFGARWREKWAEGSIHDDSELTQGVAKLRSQQSRGGPASRVNAGGHGSAVPAHLRTVQIKYSRFGVEDFDFSLYNATRHSGLEGNMRNAYANPLLQMLFFVPELRALALAHCTAARCAAAACLTCQLGFVFRMLETARGASCHARTLLHALAASAPARDLGLLEDQPGWPAAATRRPAVLAQTLLRFLLAQAAADCAGLAGPPQLVDQIFGARQRVATACTACGAGQEREAQALTLDLDPPQAAHELMSVLAGGAASIARADAPRAGRRATIWQLLGRALGQTVRARGWCDACAKFQLLQTDRAPTRPPAAYLAFNFPTLDGPDADQGWQLTLPAAFDLAAGPERSVAVQPPDDAKVPEDGSPPPRRFQLAAVVSEIREDPRRPGHLVVHVRDPDDPARWLLFNDFLVQRVHEEAVTGLYDCWRVPAVALYAAADRQRLEAVIRDAVACHPYGLSTRILTAPTSALDSAPPLTDGQGRALRNGSVALDAAEAELLRSGGFVCALDSEYVLLEDSVREEYSDGTYLIHRPPVYAMARLSAVRANGGPLHGVPFIDDYVAVEQPIADLITPFSGIHANDLTPGKSPHMLSTAKEVYLKLRLLVDSGCTFIGHGLAHDFRVCNIVVPPDQIRDTMVLFQSPANPRTLSLRFLYWRLCGEVIQSGEHSSVVDAQAALRVYERYLAAQEDGLPDLVSEIYAAGERLGWKMPAPGSPERAPSHPA